MVEAFALQRGLCLTAGPSPLEGLVSIGEGGLIQDCGGFTFGGPKGMEWVKES